MTAHTLPNPTDVEASREGVLAHWSGLEDSHGIGVMAAPVDGKVMLNVGLSGTALDHDECRSLAESLLAAIEWTGQ